MSIYVSGSLAFDRIMTFPGNFHDHIIADKLRTINVSFMVDAMEERRGGCAGNIAYSLALLGEKPIILSSAGKDFSEYAQDLRHLGLSLEGIKRNDDIFTAQGFITTDLNGNQITGFYPGAMSRPTEYTFPNLKPEEDLAIVSPGNMDDMIRLPQFYKQHGIRYIFDPGQQLTVLSKKNLLNAIQGSFALITNDYEIEMITSTLSLSPNELLGKTLWLITTLGGQGALVRGVDGTEVHIDPVLVDEVADPTGAGDAHRSGLLFGLAHGLDTIESTLLGSVSASFAVEKMGTQEHSFSRQNFAERYTTFFGALPEKIRPWLLP
ncbi:MAG: carbohydrate kinase family protein [Desulfovibrio sp.]|nr:carbohydrate kinase family protein [Desulfovibrio sp.]